MIRIISKNKKLIFIIFIIILIGTLSYFFITLTKDKNKPPIKQPIKKPEPQVEEKKLNIVDQDSNQRPIAVMIDNNIGTGRHAGLQDSYINYEIIVEGGLTRIMAIFKDKDVSLIGPVRSSRHYFLDYALESDAIYAHYGWSTYAQNDIKAMGVNNINGMYDEKSYWRDRNIAAPHNVFTSTKQLYDYAIEKNYQTTTNNWQLLNYQPEEINLNLLTDVIIKENSETGKKEKVQVTKQGLLVANSINIPYSNYQTRSYTYDQERKVYLRYMNNSQHIDKLTGNQLYYKNIIIEQVKNYQLDQEGRQDLNTVGSGTGYYITNGYALPINWTKTKRNAKTIYTYVDGSKVEVNDGNTFIQIIPTTSNITIN